MPRYFLNIKNGHGFTPDDEGRDFADLKSAMDAAPVGARSLLAEEVPQGRLDLCGRIEVTDESGKFITAIEFADAVTVHPHLRATHEEVPRMTLGQTLAQHLSCFGEMPDGDREAVEALDGRIVDLPRGRDQLSEGDRPNDVVLVLKGLLYRHTSSTEGRRQIHSFYIPTEAPCLETLYIDYMDNNLGAVIDSRIGLIPHDQIYRVIDDFRDARKLLWRQTLVQAAIFREWLVRNSNLPAHSAVAHFFCEMFTRAKAAGLTKDNQMSLSMSQEMLAQALGMTPVHANRTLQLLRATNFVEWRSGTLMIHDFDQLAELAEFDPKYLHLRC